MRWQTDGLAVSRLAAEKMDAKSWAITLCFQSRNIYPYTPQCDIPISVRKWPNSVFLSYKKWVLRRTLTLFSVTRCCGMSPVREKQLKGGGGYFSSCLALPSVSKQYVLTVIQNKLYSHWKKRLQKLILPTLRVNSRPNIVYCWLL